MVFCMSISLSKPEQQPHKYLENVELSQGLNIPVDTLWVISATDDLLNQSLVDKMTK